MPVSTISQAGLDAPISLTSPTLTTPNINSAQIATVSGTAPLYMARAWVNFNGTGTVAIRASGNVSSITDIGTGVFAVNFTTAIVDANYSISAISSTTTGNGATFTTVREAGIGGSNPSTTSFQLSIRASSFADLDVPYIYAQVFR